MSQVIAAAPPAAFAAGLVGLAKPALGAALLLTALAGMVIGAFGSVPAVAPAALAGIGLTALGAAALNNWFDRDLDARMLRTRGRALPSGLVAPGAALLLGLLLSAAGVGLLVRFVNILTAALAVAAAAVYVLPYTMLLKRRTPLAVSIGGVAGALPPVLGLAAVRGRLDAEALWLFAVMLLWQPPHFWALAAHRRGEYAAAGIPVLPAVASEREVGLRSLLHVLLLVAASLLPALAGRASAAYLAAAAALGAVYAGLFLAALRPGRVPPLRLFFFSILYLAGLLAARVADLRFGGTA